MKNQELEVKFYVSDLPAIERQLLELEAPCSQGRVLETNLRFDTPDGALAQGFKVLRLRQDTSARLTFKGPASMLGGARLRPEIEFEVSDFENARLFLEALGYQLSMAYEKYRTIYELAGVHVTLDELPYGKFVELEGPDPLSLRWVCQKLALNWEAQSPASYVLLFEQLKQELQLSFNDLTFENFRHLPISAGHLHLTPADRPLIPGS